MRLTGKVVPVGILSKKTRANKNKLDESLCPNANGKEILLSGSLSEGETKILHSFSIHLCIVMTLLTFGSAPLHLRHETAFPKKM